MPYMSPERIKKTQEFCDVTKCTLNRAAGEEYFTRIEFYVITTGGVY
jgi:hypothetical protein